MEERFEDDGVFEGTRKMNELINTPSETVVLLNTQSDTETLDGDTQE
jgi:hypothetical protein